MRCPDDEKFAQYAEGKLSEDERYEFLLHLRVCSACSTLFAMTYGHINEQANVCPNEEGISSLAEGKLSGGEREAMLKHIAVCEKCSAELFLIRKSQSAKPTARRKPTGKWKVYQLTAIAAIITLVIGLAGQNVLNRSITINMADTEQEAPAVVFDASDIQAAPPAPVTAEAPASGTRSRNDEYNAPQAAAPAPETAEEPAMLSKVSRTGAKRETEDEEYPGVGNVSPMSSGVVRNIPGYMLLSMEANPEYQKGDVTIFCEIATLSYEVIYNGHDGDESEIIRLIQSITGMDVERAKSAAGSSAIVIKECASMEEAQKVKEELESAGAKIEINKK